MPGKNTAIWFDAHGPDQLPRKSSIASGALDSEDADECGLKVLDSISAPLTLDYSGRSDDSQFKEHSLFETPSNPGGLRHARSRTAMRRNVFCVDHQLETLFRYN